MVCVFLFLISKGLGKCEVIVRSCLFECFFLFFFIVVVLAFTEFFNVIRIFFYLLRNNGSVKYIGLLV